MSSKMTAKLAFIAYDAKALDDYMKQIREVCAAKGVGFTVVALPTRNSLFCIPRSPFVYKPSKQHFYKRQMKRVVTMEFSNGQTLDMLSPHLHIPSTIMVHNLSRKKDAIA